MSDENAAWAPAPETDKEYYARNHRGICLGAVLAILLWGTVVAIVMAIR